MKMLCNYIHSVYLRRLIYHLLQKDTLLQKVFLSFVFFFLYYLSCFSQDNNTLSIQEIQIKTCVTYDGSNSVDTLLEQVYYHIYDRGQAEEIRKLCKEAKDKGDDLWEIQNIYAKEKSTVGGIIRQKEVGVNQALLVIDKEANTVNIFGFEKNKTNYTFTIHVSRIKQVDVFGHTKPQLLIQGDGYSTPEDEYWNLHIFLPSGITKPTSRMIIQPRAVALESGDTIDYTDPIVYEGAAYHQTQDKRMDYNFFKRDALADYYKSSIVLDTGAVSIDTTIVYHKPLHHRSTAFKSAAYTLTLEDYHHEYFREVAPGEYPKNPLKFIESAVATDTMDLVNGIPWVEGQTDYFKVESVIKRITVPMVLNILFEENKAILTNDSINTAEFQRLISELRAHPQIDNVNIIGGASPDGKDDHNLSLAGERVKKAISIIQPELPRGLHARSQTKVYTWSDVLAALEKEHFDAEAKSVREIVESGKSQDAMDGPMKALPFYDEIIKPILVKQRSFICEYTYIDQRPLSVDEVYERFLKYKNNNQLDSITYLSDGDIYNLYTIADSAEQDLVTEHAYKMFANRSDLKYDKFGSYVANRMAMLKIKLGQADSTILQPFICDTLPKLYYLPEGDRVLVNLPGILINQAITFLQQNDLKRASSLVKRLTMQTPVTESPKIRLLSNVVNFIRNFLNEEALSGEDRQEYEKAKEYMLSSSPDNRAVLYTEVSKWGMRKKAPLYISQMDDNNPRKWYLRGILYTDSLSKKADIADLQEKKHIEVPGFEDFRELSDDEYDHLDPNERNLYENRRQAYEEAKKQVEGESDQTIQKGQEFIPYYLGYFQHCFDMDPSYMKYYMIEGNVPVKVRKQYKYKIKNIDMYRRLFDKYLKPLETKASSHKTGNVSPTVTETSEKDANALEETEQTTE